LEARHDQQRGTKQIRGMTKVEEMGTLGRQFGTVLVVVDFACDEQ
jgi:hypothetical protein